MEHASMLGRISDALRRQVPRPWKVRFRRVMDHFDGVTKRWDREWVTYFTTEDPWPFLVRHTALTVATDVAPLTAREMHTTRLTHELPPLQIFMPGARLVGGRVMEVGCGPGLLCKQLGLVASQVLGLDHSRLAVNLARSVSPPTCRYHHTSEVRQLRALHGSFDCMVCRHFFIHQNYRSALKVLGLARQLLKPGGLVGADFYLPGPAVRPQYVYPARRRLSRLHPSAAFLYSPEQIDELAGRAGFRAADRWDNPEAERRFVLLERQ